MKRNTYPQNTPAAHRQPEKHKRVAIVYRFLPQYRVDFYEGLRKQLRKEGVEFQLFYGKTKANPKKDEVDLDWGSPVKQTQVKLFGKPFLYQHLPKSIYESDLMILVQENRLLSNLPLAIGAHRRGLRVALWGHGANLQAKANSFGNRLKKLYSTRADWWFAYTSQVARRLTAMGYPGERITITNNAINTRGLIEARASVTEDDLSSLRAALNLGRGPIGLYCGAMYTEKRMSFLLKACEIVRQANPQFELILLGTGPDAALVKSFAAEHPWVHYAGPKLGLERVPYFAVSQVLLMPGAVGLVVLDSFALGTPIITTTYPFHGPEFEYIDNGVNGLISDDNLVSYARAVVDAIANPSALCSLEMRARQSATKYTVEAMVSNFTSGVLQALDSPPAP